MSIFIINFLLLNSDDELERSVYSPDVDNMKGIDILGSKMKHKPFI